MLPVQPSDAVEVATAAGVALQVFKNILAERFGYVLEGAEAVLGAVVCTQLVALAGWWLGQFTFPSAHVAVATGLAAFIIATGGYKLAKPSALAQARVTARRRMVEGAAREQVRPVTSGN